MAAAARERRLERRREAEQSSVARPSIMYSCMCSTHTTRAADIPFGDIIDDALLREFNLTIPIECYRLLMLTYVLYIDRVSYFEFNFYNLSRIQVYS